MSNNPRYVIAPYPGSPSCLCADGSFVLGYVFDMGMKDTLMYKSKYNADKKLEEVKKQYPTAVLVAI
jgi:hypothetical protein